MKSKILLIIAIIGLCSVPTSAQGNLAQKLSGRILLQVESRGQAWYVNPADQKRYFLGRPQDAFDLMRALGVGITNSDLAKIPVSGQPPADLTFIRQQLGKIFLQVENSGQAWYVNPADWRRYFLGRPDDAWQIMRNLSLGITNTNLEQITVGQIQLPDDNPPPVIPPTPNPPPVQTSVLDLAAKSIRDNNSTQAQTYFIESMRPSIKYSIEHLSAESRLLLANILSGAKLESSSDTEKIYSNTAYFSLKEVNVSLHFRVQKQPDGTWLIANL